jgi:hypothetical protein
VSNVLVSTCLILRPNQVSAPKDRIMLQAFTRLTEKYTHGRDKLKFATSKGQRDEALSEIRAKIKRLERILAASDQVAAFEEPSKLAVSRQSVSNLMGYWKHADRIFALLLSSWVCPCRQKHCAHLWLQHRTSAHFEFRILVMFAATDNNPSLVAPWQQHGLKIEWTSSKDPVAKQLVAAALMPPPQRMVLPSAIAGQRLKSAISSGQRRADRPVRASIRCVITPIWRLYWRANVCCRFGGFPVAASSVVSEPELKKNKRLVVCATSQPRSTSRDVISNLCHTMQSCGMQSECLGLLVDASQGDQYQVSSQPEQKVVAGEITLREILHSDHKPRVPRAQRFQIALKVASSHLQLHSTSWARRHWESGDVRFPQIGKNAGDILLDRPFVSANFEPELPSTLRVPKATDRSFACLGIMMLELLFGAQLEEHDLWQQFGAMSTDNPVLRLMVAKKWADDVKDEAGPEFSSAVKWCLDESPATLHSDQWRKDLACEVVLPLQNCCGWIDRVNDVVDD